MVSSGALTITLLVLVCQLTAYTIFGQYIHKADRAEQAFFLMQIYVKRFKQMALLVAGLDEGLSSFSLSNLLYMENPYSYKKYR